MNGIDSAITAVLSSRIDSLLGIAPGTATTSQTGATGVDTAPAEVVTQPTAAPQPSAQTALSAVALTLNAIAHSGGEATPAVLGDTPIWPAAPALDVAVAVEGVPLDAATNASSSSSTSSTPNASATGTTTTSATAAASVAAAEVPVAALAAALARTVGDSGLFYEAHLAAWLVGQRSPAELAGEAQNRLVAGLAVTPGWSDADDGTAVPGAGAWPSQTGASADDMATAMPRGNPGNPGGTANGALGNFAGAPTDPNAAAHAMPSILTAQAARLAAGEVLASSVSDLNGQSTHAGLHGGAPQTADADATQNAQAMAAAVHPATVPLVRQQLDLLATGQFRWSGEAWPGARLDWTVEQDGDEWDRSGGGLASEDDQPWRTRLTLSLPTLGTVDAELTLTGMRLTARVQASPNGAARLSTQGDSFRQRLAAAGIELQGLTIREIGGGTPGMTASAAGAAGLAGAQAASAYVRSAAAAAASTPQPTATRGASTTARDDFDWEI
ncbi:flagellar hook-length control protein FliK [Paraburkholderia antibiotica]|uniref:Flagellar hook-length control protein FliK n=1 Tax=Paraburkholderia antibiotica TaxID=2728839 RepID=A0A7X9ZXG5_9BURK|nr:flagellar hook-length control protein FliK [Paraburkholderia antibiotica]NML32032.1 flagellar hook-length control protein FliK [Paraburkholderia antibiotica]